MSILRTRSKLRLTLQILLPILCVGWLTFILSNSLKTGVQSSQQSSTVVEWIQRVAEELAPDGWIANAEGEDYLRLHGFIRKAAHFCEYALFGALLCWCYFAYTLRLKWSFFPLVGVLLLPPFDELLQTTVSGRAGDIADVYLDISGGLVGLVAAGLVGLIIVKKIKKKEKKWKKKV